MAKTEHGKLTPCPYCGKTPPNIPDDSDCCCGVACVICGTLAEYYCEIQDYGIEDYCEGHWQYHKDNCDGKPFLPRQEHRRGSWSTNT